MSNRKATVTHPKVMHFGNVYVAPLLLPLGHCGCIYDSTTWNSTAICMIDWSLVWINHI